MILHTVWAVRKHAPDEPELVTAWDEYSVDNNPEGFKEDWEKGLASWGDDLLTHRHIQILVPYREILEPFEIPRAEGFVV